MSNQDPILEYQTPTPTSPWAVVVFWAAIAAALGFFLVIPSLLVFLAAVVVQGRISPIRDARGYRRATIAGWISAPAAGLGFVLFITAGMTGGHPRELSNRAVCAANVRGIMQSMLDYAGDNNGRLPLVPYAPYATVPNAAKGVATGTSDEVEAARKYYTGTSGQAGSVQACLWMMVMGGQIAPKQFLCKSDPWASNSAAITSAGGLYDNFQNGTQLSYSVAYPWDAAGKPGAWWNATIDSSLPLIADMNPLQGTGTPARNLTPARAPSDHKTWNSNIHQGDGQNVGFGDAHAEFSRTPCVGHDNDNIYTMSGAPSKGPAQFGGIPAGKTAPALTADKAPFDIILLPVRNESTGAM
jgi:hypothetical protein